MLRRPKRAPPPSRTNQPAASTRPQQQQPSQARPPAQSNRPASQQPAQSRPAQSSRAANTPAPSPSPSKAPPAPQASSSNPPRAVSSTSTAAIGSSSNGVGQYGSSNTSSSENTNNNTTAIVAGVCASIGGIILILLVWRFMKRQKSTTRKVPLPPVQEIAHFREQDRIRQLGVVRPVSSWTSSPGTDVESTYAPFQNKSDISSGLTSPSDTSYSLTSSPSPAAMEVTAVEPLVSTTASPPTSADTMSSTSTMSTTYGLDLNSDSATPDFTHPHRRLNHSISQSTVHSTRSRAVSYARSNATGYRSGNTPHSIYGNVQIVLPTPLAPQSSSSPFTPSEFAARRATIVDAWTSHTVMPAEQDDRTDPRHP